MDPKYRLLSELGSSMIDRWLAKNPEWSAWLDRRAVKAAEVINAKAADWDLPVRVDGPQLKRRGTLLAAGLFVVALPLLAKLKAGQDDEKAKDEFIKAREDALFKVVKKSN